LQKAQPLYALAPPYLVIVLTLKNVTSHYSQVNADKSHHSQGLLIGNPH